MTTENNQPDKPLHHLRRFTHIGRNVALISLALAMAAVGFMFTLLLSAPLPINWAVPWLEQAIQNDAGIMANLNISDLALMWNADTHRVEFTADHVRLAEAAKTLTAVERVNITLSMTSLLQGQLHLKDVTLIGPQLHLALGAGGSAASGAAAPLAFLSRGNGGALSRLHSITIQHGAIDLAEGDGPAHDSLNDVQIYWERHGQKSLGTFAGTLRLSGDLTPKMMRGSMTQDKDGTDLTLAADAMRPESIQHLLDIAAPGMMPTSISLNQLQMPVALNGTLHLDAKDVLQTVGGEIIAGMGQVIIPEFYDTALPVENLKISGAYHADTHDWDISDLHMVIFDEDGPIPVALQARADTQKRMTTVTASIHDMSVAALKRWWPSGTAPGAIAWIHDNLSAGKLPHIDVSLELTRDEKDNDNITAAKGGWDMQGITSKFLPTLPAVTNIDGNATFTGPDSLHFDLHNGRLGNIQLLPATMDIAGLNANAQTLKIDVPATGQLPEILAMIDMPPYGYATKYGLRAPDSHGGVGMDLQFELPLLATLKLSDLKYHAIANLDQVTLPGALMGKDITAGKGVFELTPDQMNLNGVAAIADVPIQFIWQDFSAPKDGLTRRVDFNSELQDNDHARLGLPTAGYVHGPAKLTGSYEEHGTAKNLLTKLDLTTASVVVKELGYTKPVGALMAINAAIANGNHLSLTATGPNMALDGMGVLNENMQPQKLDFGVFRFGDRTNAKLSFEKQAASEHWMITGQRFNATGFFTPDTTEPRAPPPLRWIGMKLDSLFLAHDVELKNVQAELNHNGKHWDKFLLHGDLLANTPLNISWDARKLAVATDDAGDALKAFGITDSFRGGRLTIDGVAHTNAEWLADGNIRMRDFKIAGAPLLAKLLAVTSPGGLLDTLRGDGVGFSTLRAQFQYSDAVLRLQQGKVNGQSLGLTFDGDIRHADLPNTLTVNGTIVPLYLLNTALSNVPLLGGILGGKDGLLAFNYQATGSVTDPNVNVNPLSALAPGFLRDLLFDNAAPEKNP